MNSLFIMFIKGNATRGTRIAVCVALDADVLDDDAWRDMPIPIYLDTYFETREEAIQAGTNYAGIDEFNIEVIDVKSLEP